ncbi:hypothetical protein AB0G00_33770 [Nocardia salmonicida]|uniref:effector-associated constant component EACC1 n=1 Tax=Nocardia salmonicida TaxID=53431 RepID=UPI002E2E293B|nr:hypothetical protein [Nocardia salmonicida]
MEIVIRVASDELPVDLASLRSWLIEEDDLRGRVQTMPAVPEPGKLGGLSDVLVIALGTGGVATVATKVLANTVIAWLRLRTGDVTVTVNQAGGSSMTYKATNVRNLTLAEADSAAQELAGKLVAAPVDEQG